MCMSDEHTLKLHPPKAGIPGECPVQRLAADRDRWSQHAGKHYRELAHWLRGVAAKCRLPNPQRELLVLASRYERQADHHFGGR